MAIKESCIATGSASVTSLPGSVLLGQGGAQCHQCYSELKSSPTDIKVCSGEGHYLCGNCTANATACPMPGCGKSLFVIPPYTMSENGVFFI